MKLSIKENSSWQGQLTWKQREAPREGERIQARPLSGEKASLLKPQRQVGSLYFEQTTMQTPEELFMLIRPASVERRSKLEETACLFGESYGAPPAPATQAWDMI